MSEDRGPIESREWPRELSAHAVTPGEEPRLLGYDVEGDLAVHYRFSDVILLALTGELPEEARSRAFEAVLVFASAMSVAEAPIHATVLARLCGARPGGVFSVATLALAEHAERIVGGVDSALAADAPALPASLSANDDSDRRSVRRLEQLVGNAVDVPALKLDPSREVAIIATLRACGLTTSFQLASALVFARLPSAIAEANATKPGDFAGYPMDTPHFAYEAPSRRRESR